MKQQNPPLTVLMPAYNAERYIAMAIQSVLDQTFGDFELLIVDDGSVDRTAEIIRGFADPRIRLVSNNTNLRMAATLNRGLQLARGDLVARMDADDIADSRRLAVQMRYLADNPRDVLVGTGMTLIDANGRRIGISAPVTDPDLLRWRNQFANQIAHPTVMFRRGPLDRLGLQYGAVPAWAAQPAGVQRVDHLSEDYLMFGLLALRERIGNIPDRLLQYRMHDQSVSGSHSDAQMATAVKVSALLLGQVLGRPAVPEVVKLIYYTRQTDASDAPLVSAACQLIDAALSAHVGSYGLTSAQAARLRRDADLRKRVLRSGSEGVWRRVAGLLTPRLWPRDSEERKLTVRSLISEQSVERIKQWRSRSFSNFRLSTKL